MTVAVIGGSGFYDFLSHSAKEILQTPYGQVEPLVGTLDDQQIVFIARHGAKHSIPPHMINFKANIHALHQLGVTRIFSTNAVGSCRSDYAPGDFVLLSSFLDLFFANSTTFFDGSATIVGRDGTPISGVVHTDMSEPYCSQLRKTLFHESKSLELMVHSEGVYAMMKGPRFESPAEIEALKRLGADVVGMTNVPEVVLARELGMCYATVTVITNYAAGMQERITHAEVTEMFDRCINSLKTLLKRSIKSLPAAKDCSC